MPLIDGGEIDVLNGNIDISNLISPIAVKDSDKVEIVDDDHLIITSNGDNDNKPQGEINENSLTLATIANQEEQQQQPQLQPPTLSELLNQLNDNYERTEEKINETFESLRFALDHRKTYLLNELKLFYEEKKAMVSIQPSEDLLLEQFDLDVNDSELLKKTNPTDNNSVLNSLINNYGRVVRLKTQSTLFDCLIEGKGLSQCTVNEETCFTLSFKNKNDLRTSNVSFLDIYIITSEVETTKTLPSNKRAITSSTNTKSANSNLHYTKAANCDCTLEVLAEGIYLVKYKLTKRGVYSLNILVNKKHIGQSPYRLVCLDRRSLLDHTNRPRSNTVASSNKSLSSLNVRSSHSALNNGDSKTKPTKSSHLTKNLYNSKFTSSSSASLLLPGTSQQNNSYSYSTPRSITPSSSHNPMSINNTKTTKQPFSTYNRPQSHQSTARQNLSSVAKKTAAAKSVKVGQTSLKASESSNNVHNTSHDDSVVSSAASSSVPSGRDRDSLSPSTISPAVSKTNINLSMASSALFMSSSTSLARLNGANGAAGFMNGAEDDFLFQIGRRGRAHSEFMNPQAVCATADTIYITDSSNQKIEAFSHNGEYKFTLGAPTNHNSSNSSIHNTSFTATAATAKIIRRPIGIDSNCKGKILCVDYELKCVNVFEESGRFLGKICQNRLLGPKGIAINKAHQNEIVIADSKANSVCIFDSDGKFLLRFGNLGSKNENFAGPQYLSCMSNGDIVVTDFYNHCIKVFDAEGKFKFSFGSNGSEQGQFNGPTGISTDSKDNIIIVDWGNSRIQVFDKHGNFIRFINSEFNQLYGPQDVAIINNTIAVADSGNHCVKIFEYS